MTTRTSEKTSSEEFGPGQLQLIKSSEQPSSDVSRLFPLKLYMKGTMYNLVNSEVVSDEGHILLTFYFNLHVEFRATVIGYQALQKSVVELIRMARSLAVLELIV
ncbi:hypothetical protein PsorP6_002251 [Peronosclerospora sorghi]|uniref:Uncharacterized protein n=1 Tax=Peronosclerospora sorghi TaxID=230839 RepID=A0ACC0WYG8_9STRA|nr:hypothetical protein PsorP6_002251 [Peronosclerospora sorghi]